MFTACRHRLPLFLASATLIALASCAPYPEGLRPTPQGEGPMILVDWDARPLPELPFPNDLAARPDPNSPTGLRLNFSEDAPTELEREARRKVNELSGFGIFAPLSVRFTRPLDLDRIASAQANDLRLDDDLFFVIDVTEGSPTYGQAVDLDVGHGRFPVDVVQTDRYFLNDPRSQEPSITFDTVNEDVNGNGVMDPGEDTDNDGILDVANVYPEGGDPRDDLLTFYERTSDTLIFRPALPLREETTYAVVLTERLLGVNGEPIRSPWPYVHHTRQTEALRPLLDVLPGLGLSMDDVGFAWTFTTARVTGDLVDLRRGLDGEGPFAALAEEIPTALLGPVRLHELSDVDNPYALPAMRLFNTLATLGLLSGSAEPIMREGFSWAENIVGGRFLTPDLLFDRDDNGQDSSEESWQLDAAFGQIEYEPLEVAFTCIIPKEDDQHQQPFPFTLYGHGYGSSRFEFMTTVGWGSPRIGVATCALDYPSHGISLSADNLALIEPTLTQAGLMPFLDHLRDDRARDLDNDGVKDSGADQWSSDGFHTRDQVRQGALDMMVLLRALRACGTDPEALGPDVDGDGKKDILCDWDGNGVPDIGGPDVDTFFAGGSLGGIVTSVAAVVEPDIQAGVPIVSGGGLFDIGTRSNIGGAVEALQGRMWSPFLVGLPDPTAGTLRIAQHVNSAFVNMATVPIADLQFLPTEGSVEVHNLANGIVRSATIPADGRFRISFPADALSGPEKRMALAIPESGPAMGEVYSFADNADLGDPLRVVIRDGNGEVLKTLETFEIESVFQGVTLAQGSKLVAVSEGLGHIRSTPELRRLVSSLALITEPGDPIAYAPHIFLEPFDLKGAGPRNILQINTVGDPIVMVNAGVAQARASGFLEMHEIDPRYGMTVDNWLIDRRVVHGLEEFGPYTDADGNPALFDPDDLDDGLDPVDPPSDTPLRATVQTSSGVSGYRIPYADPKGSHSPGTPDPDAVWDWGSFVINQALYFIHTRGQEILEDPCMSDNTCDWLRGAQ